MDCLIFSYVGYRSLIAPLERLKLIQQTNQISLQQDNQQIKSKNVQKDLKQLRKDQGFMTLWRGNGTNALRIGLNLYIRKQIQIKDQQFLSGAIVSVSITHPLDVIKTRLSCDFTRKYENQLYKGLMDCMKKSVKNRGIQSLYQGFSNQLFYQIKYFSLSMALHSQIQIALISSFVSILILHPFDTLKQRQYMSGSFGFLKIKNEFKINPKEIKLLYKGIVPTILQLLPQQYFQIQFYDMAMQAKNEWKY